MSKIISSIYFVCLFSVLTFAQSVEQGQIYNKYATAAEEGVNLFSGTSSLNRNLITISSGRVSASVELNYFGNVSEAVANKNDIAPTSWVGLGWSLGYARIVSEDAGTMWMGDDSYFLETSSGLKYKILKSGKNADNSDKWWIESLPYWSVKPFIENVQFGNNNYDIVVGWEVRDDAGNKYLYGDDYGNGNYYEYVAKRNATEYTLANPYSIGVVGVIDNGRDELFPKAWNLRKSEDYDGNYLEYKYEQFVEKVLIRHYIDLLSQLIPAYTTPSINSYTKECYLKSIKTSQGESVVFETKQKDYKNEFIDKKGEVEKDASDLDAYIDPIERRYLSKITVQKEVVNKNGEKEQITIKNIDFCYKPLNVEFNKEKNSDGKSVVDDNSEYVKRLLISVAESSEKGEIQKELYSYYENDFDPDTKLPLNVGALRSVKSNNCGTVEYIYEEQELNSQNSKYAVQYDELPLVNIIMGTLDDGTTYIAGLNKNEKLVQVYHRINGGWKLIQNLNKDSYNGKTKIAKYDSEGQFIAGDKNWFIYEETESETYRPYVWNGLFWENQKEIVDGSSRNFVEPGPGYILKARLDDEKITLTMPWNIWNGGSDDAIMDRSADDDENDRLFTAIFTSKNHFGVFFKDKGAFNSGHLKIFSFQPDKSIKQTYDEDDLDDDNHYGFLDDNILIGGTEGRDLTGQYAKAYHFYENDNREPKWAKFNLKELDGWQGYVDIMGMGDGYFVLRHNDNDDLSLFEFDGLKWSAKVDGRNMVHQDYDPKTEAEWVSFNGYNYFAVLFPYIERHWYYNYIRPERNYGYYYKENKDWKWKTLYEADSKSEGRRKIYAGAEWFVVKEHQKAWINNGKEWKEEEWKNDNSSDFPFYGDNIRSLNGDFLVAEYDSKSWIIYKKKDSFTSGINGFLVKSKIVDDPISDKNIVYTYGYHTLESGYPIYDYVTKSPVVKGVYVILPENVGRVEKILCDGNGDMAGVAKGQVCKEAFYQEGLMNGLHPLNKTEKKYKRYRGKNNSWPNFIYLDQLTEVTTENRNIRTKESYSYADELNDLKKSIIVKNLNTGKNISETVNVFAAEVDAYKNEIKKDNRLIEKAAVYQCVPDCNSGKVVSGHANKYVKDDKDTDDQNHVNGVKLRISEEWSYLPKDQKDSKFSFDWSKSSFTSWKKTKTYSHFYRGLPTQSEDLLGLNTSLLFDKGASNKVHATVDHAGIDEILLMPGDTCGIKNWDEYKCKIVSLNGRFFEKSDPNANNVDYGRFSNKAVYVMGGNDLSGYVLHAKKSKYRFSAWVQGTDFGNVPKSLNLKINGQNAKSFPLKGKGEWEYVDWVDVSEYNKNSTIAISLSSSDGSEIRLQDIRFVPVDASVSVEFYDRVWNKPIASVDDRGLGSYFVYDDQGRVIQTYGENAKREVLLKTKNTFVPGMCGVPGANYSLKKLVINGFDVPLTGTPGTIDLAVEDDIDELDISWETVVEGERVYYRLYENGKESTSSYVQDDCCASSKKLVGDFEGTSMVLDIAVSTTDRPYRITLNKSTTGWVDYGKNLGVGSVPVFFSNNNVSGIFYLNDGDLHRAYYSVSDWKKYSEKQNTFIEYIGSVVNQGSSYVFALPDLTANNYNEVLVDALGANAKGLFSTISSLQDNRENKLVRQSDFEGAGVKSRHYRIVSNQNNTESYVVYEKITSVKTEQKVSDERHKIDNPNTSVIKTMELVKKDTSLIAKKLQGNGWTNCGTVLNSGVEDVSLAVGPQNIPYVAYIGKSASRTVTKTLIDDPEGKLNNVDPDVNPEGIPDNLKDTYSEQQFYVVVKHLEKNDGSNKWIGYSSNDGDILQLNGQDLLGAKKVKLASDGNNIYIAVLYDELQNSSKFALKVFKLERVSNELKFIEIVDSFVESSTIAYLDEYNHFDLEVSSGVPYLSFENEDNDNYVSVLKFDSGRWKSIGRPAFAKISTEKYSLDFAMSNNIPYVVFKESEESSNTKRQGKIVSKKYSTNDDMDLTISSIGDKDASSLYGMFRQYIMNYKYDVSKTTNQVTFNILLSNVNHVRAVSIKNNGNEVFNWKKHTNIFSLALFDHRRNGDLSSAIVPLVNGKNKIQIQVWGENAKTLTYNFTIRKDYVAGLSVKVKDVNGNEALDVYKVVDGVPITSPTAEFDNSSSSAVVIPGNPTVAITPPDDGSNTKNICLEHNSAWRMIVNGCIFSKNECFEYDFVNRTIIVPAEKCKYTDDPLAGSSSSTAPQSSSNTSKITFVDKDGNEQDFDIVVIDGSKPTIIGYSSSWYNLESSSSSTPSGDISSSSDISENSSSSWIDIDNSSSSIENTSSSSQIDEFSSSSSIPSSSSSIPDISSSSAIEHSEIYGDVLPGTAIPQDFGYFLDYKFVGGEKITFANFVTVNNGDFIAGLIDVSANAQIHGTLMSYGNVFVGSNAYIHTFVVGGNKEIQQGAIIENYREESVAVPQVPTMSFSYGIDDVNVMSDNPVVLHPGSYRNINVFTNASVVFEPGVYYIKSLYVAPDASIDLQTTHERVQLWIQDDVSIGDRSTFYCRGGASKCFIYGNNTGYMYLGVNVNVDAYVAYPYGYVELAPNATLSGAIWAKSVTAGANAIIK